MVKDTVKAARRGWGGVIALLCAAAFLILSISAQYLHSDEELSYRATNGTLIDTIRWQTSLQDNQAPLWFVTFNLWRTLVGDHETTARIGMILMVLPALALVYQIARRGFKSRMAGALGVFVLVGNHLFFNYALDIRPYPLVMLVSAFSIWTLQSWLMRGRRRRDALVYGLSLALMLYTHYLLVLFAAVQVIYVLCVYRLTRERIAQAIQAAILAVLLWLPWIPVFLSHMALLRSLSSSTGDARGAAGITVSTQPTTLENIGKLIDAATNGQWGLYAAILLIGLLLVGRKRAYWLALMWALLTPALYLIVNFVAATYAPRYISFALLGLGMAIGSALAFLPRVRKAPLALPLIAAVGLVALNLYAFPFQTSIPPREPYRDVFRAMNEAAQPGDAVLMVRGGEGDPLVDLDAQLYLDPALIAATTTDQAAAAESRRVWFVTRDWFGEGVQDAFHQLETTHPLQQVIGQCTRAWCILSQLMEAPPLNQPVVFGGVLPFYGIDRESDGLGIVTARLWWRIQDQPPVEDYSFSLQLIHIDTGQLVAQNDGPIRSGGGDVVPTSAMQPGQIYIDQRTVMIGAVPIDLFPGRYAIYLVVYNPATGERLRLLDGADHLQVGDVTLGT